jgi:hypothetical protein
LGCGAEGTTSKLIGGDNASGVTLSNVTLGSACPRCGGDMKVIDGTYSFADGVMTAFRRLDAESLREVESVLRQRQRGDVELAAAIAQVSAVSSELGGLMERMSRQPQWTAPVVVNTLLAVIAVVLAWMALNSRTTLTDADHEALRHDISTAIEQTRSAAKPPQAARRQASPKRAKRPGKTHGKQKRRRRP